MIIYEGFFNIQILAVLFLSVLMISCNRTDDEIPDFPEGSTEAVNVWVQDSMRRYYYWADQMPAKPDYHLPTQDFLKVYWFLRIAFLLS
ncbi:hypothetical protein [Chryseobacterium wanjuense]